MVRSIFYICASLVALASSALAQDCSRIRTPSSQYVGLETRDYVPIKLMIEIAAGEKTPEEAAQNAYYRFLIHAAIPDLRLDSQGGIDYAENCGDSMALRVRGRFIQYTDDGFILGTALFLPRRIVAQKPFVETRLNTGDLYVGEWGMSGGHRALFLRRLTPNSK